MNSNNDNKIFNGIDNLINNRHKYAHYKKIGLVSNSKALTAGHKINLIALIEAGFDVCFIFSPEHGYFANIADGDYIADAGHPELNIPILSLFTEGHSRNAISEALTGAQTVDAVFFDIQDAGVRFYTYIHALGLTLAACEKQNIPLLVLDRPNPVSAASLEGGLPVPDYFSELCPYSIPLRYGLTIGELALYLKGAVYKNAAIEVAEIQGAYSRDMIFPATGLKWNAPSPAMLSPETALFYPGTCLFEGVNLSEGRGTAAPFQTLGAPFIDANAVIGSFYDNLNSLAISDFDFLKLSAASFKPVSSKYENTLCSGIYITFKDVKARNFKSLLLGVILLKTIYDLNKDKINFLFSEKSRKFFIDRLAGGPALREAITNGDIYDVYSLYLKWADEAKNFSNLSACYRIYK